MCGVGGRVEATARLVFHYTHNKCVQWSAGIGVLNVELVLHPRPLTHSVRCCQQALCNKDRINVISTLLILNILHFTF